MRKSEGEKKLDRQLDRVVSAAYEEAAAEISAEADTMELAARAAKVRNAKGLITKIRSLFPSTTGP